MVRESEVSSMYAPHSSPATTERQPAARQGRTDRDNNHDNGYELFRRAILLHDGDAWIEISARFRPMLIAWAGQCSASGSTDDQCEDIADRALARAWAALTPGRFEQFPTLAALLAYLRTCISATAIDAARAQVVRDRTYGKLEVNQVATPEEVVLDEIERGELWQAAIEAAASERERVVLVESFQFELPPRAILSRHPDLFTTISEVYLAKRHVLGRLQRSAAVRRFL
jgi:DNA-directed RNA polymerase specialized sigma24 family protein